MANKVISKKGPLLRLLLAAFIFIFWGDAFAQTRLPDIPSEQYTVEQQKAAQEFEVAQALKEGRWPEGMSEDEAIVYDFTLELQKNKQVSNATFARTESRFGKKGAIDLAGIAGYYTFLAMEMNMARRPIPANAERLPRLPQ